MTHLASTLPDDVEQGAQRSLDWGTEVVGTDSGAEVRNNRWSEPLRVYEISYPVRQRTDETYLAVVELYAEAEGNLHSFDFMDWADGVLVPVRFDGPLRTTGVAEHLESIEVTLVEVREDFS
jgi:uncharacterized protein (TIGR02217 family)